MNLDMIVTRDVTPDECDWLDETVTAGTKVKRFTKYTYGCINNYSGVAVSYTDDYPFFELPRDSVQEVSSE